MGQKSGARDFWKLAGLGVFVLGVSAWVLHGRVTAMSTESTSNRELIKQTAPDLSKRTIPELEEGIIDVKSQIYATATLFNPQSKWLRDGYDVSILFVEELNNANQQLKDAAADMQVQFPGIVFAEKLPAEGAAVQLLTQLYGIREVAELAISLGADILDITPEPAADDDGFTHGAVLPASMEFSFPHETVVEFLIRITGVVPKIAVTTLAVKTEDEAVLITLDMSTIFTQFDLTDEEKNRYSVAGVPEESYPQGIQRAVSLMRGNSPFVIPERRKEEIMLAEEASAEPEPEPEIPRQRFYFRGKATLQSQEVAVVEDTMRQETVFLARGERYDTYLMKDFSDDGIILEGIDDKAITVINREDNTL